MRIFIFLITLSLLLNANIAIIPDNETIAVKGKFARNKKCIRCHLDIYKEFKHSAHHHSNILNNEAHKAMWQSNPLSKKQKYVCAKCHAPATQTIDKIIAGEEKILPTDISMDDGISCAFCHRIETTHPTDKGDHYILSKTKQKYFGSRKSQQKSDFHKIDSNNTTFKTGDICLSCHAHHKKQKLLISNKKENSFENFCVFSYVDENTTKTAQNNSSENCISCHMPKIYGSFTDRYSTPTHRSHKFLGLRNKFEDIKKYLDLILTLKEENLTVKLINKMPHDMILHPTRMFKLQIYADTTLLKETIFEKESQSKKIKPLVWLKDNINYKNNLLAKSIFLQNLKLSPKTKQIKAVLGYYLIKPSIAKKIDLKNEKDTKFHILIEENLQISGKLR